MSDGNRGDQYSLKKLAVALAVWVGTGLLLWAALTIHSIGVRRAITHQPLDSRCAQSENYACDGLQANIRAANANEDAVDIAILQFWLGFTGLVGVGLTVFYARLAWIAAQNSAEAAKTLLRQTADHTELQMRAYCAPDSYEIATEPGADPQMSDLVAKVVVKNYGQTPAFHFKGWIGCYSFSKQAGKLRRPMERVPWTGRFVLGPGGVHTLRVKLRIPNEANLPDEQIIISGSVKYRDRFNKTHLTRIRYFFVGGADPLIPAKNGNWAT